MPTKPNVVTDGHIKGQKAMTVPALGLYSLTFLQNILSLVLQISLHLEAFECNTTSDWLNHMVYPIRNCVAFQFINIRETD